ncbi:hypothetical protein SAMN04488112_11780 [Melghirimyces thermohalophilus]|jgi:hypothetical protein|uniref:Uncharacterized protein n=1 Tax=Melghirimyces thermohalophilus TaxID=1236220 RepID=A0A1G6PP99_9BACL|nr:hypothetical protein [Melghirimyces thermohalophilus]SDC81993.1 hypothetical protein SAMN04488112_11780 [Melghirimyces thermohalophilus]
MAKYRGKYVFGGTAAGSADVLDQLKAGDELSLIGAFGKVKQLKIKETYRYKGRRVYVTDALGIIYADEVVAVNMPAWKKTTIGRKAKVV